MASLLVILFISGLTHFSFTSSSPIPFRSEYEISLLYEGWLVKHNKVYEDRSEKEKRYEIFKDNLKYIDEHNTGNHTFTLALNVFADITVEEYRATYLGTLPPPQGSIENDDNDDKKVVPDSIDWRELGAVTPVMQQGGCFSCWAFTAVATVEAINQIVTGDLISLSKQQLVDCDHKSCSPYYIHKSLEYIKKNGGIDTEEDYPYKAKYIGCNATKAKNIAVTIDGYKWAPRNNENGLKAQVSKQPVGAAVEGYGRDFQLYGKGIFTKYCGKKQDHAVTIIGYGTDGNTDYWLIKNSWGDFWGEAGYMRLERNIQDRAGKCGVAEWPVYPVKNKHISI
ncbi:zingipain-2-like [Dioscorea cayenensis subsp. rotundata]|uniref:Zingipain-2-like n=1 Tax=Dioscorea cayennensis subsp. rotundata TaxID=55577 RepID=A0AB40C0T0_DIOCR|nr:zingipain-2-like [Dioscorea cayenensis subsp. rotundata]